MKRILLPLLLIPVLVAVSAAETRVSFHLSGGLNYAAGGDITRGLKGQSAFLLDEFGAEGELASPIWGFQVNGELLYHFTDHFALGIGAGYFEHMKQTQASYPILGLIDVRETVTPKYKVIPITANLHYSFPWFGPVSLDLYAGAGVYLTGLDFSYRQDFSVLGFNGSGVYDFNASKAGFGVQGGLNVEWVIDPKFSILLALSGRVASVSGFTGDWSETLAGDIFENQKTTGSGGQIWFYEWNTGGLVYDQIIFGEEEPVADSEVTNVRPARLGLTGFTAALGFKIKLF
ncbi:MAG: outer membrane beta-barrel protein [Candidatus Aminicenantes bacterium]|nr:outer membrane beta-barrel protein [Candidatus Aminicenantes bacterium]